MARNMHKYEELTPFEFGQEKERASIVYVSAGPLEYHEECNILGADTNKGYDWCLAAAEITGGIVFPMLPVAPAFGGGNYMTQEKLRSQYKLPHHRDEYADNFGSLYPSIFFSSEVCKMMYKELLDMLADEIGFKLCVFVGSHGPAAWMIKDIVIEESNGKKVYGTVTVIVAKLCALPWLTSNSAAKAQLANRLFGIGNSQPFHKASITNPFYGSTTGFYNGVHFTCSFEIRPPRGSACVHAVPVPERELRPQPA